jgi:hypothetical protein
LFVNGEQLKPFLCGAQEVIADAIAEMITTGATEENLTSIVLTVMDHNWRRRFSAPLFDVDGNSLSKQYTSRESKHILEELV